MIHTPACLGCDHPGCRAILIGPPALGLVPMEVIEQLRAEAADLGRSHVRPGPRGEPAADYCPVHRER